MNKPIMKPEWIPAAYLDVDKNTPSGNNNLSKVPLRGLNQLTNTSNKKGAKGVVQRKKDK